MRRGRFFEKSPLAAEGARRSKLEAEAGPPCFRGLARAAWEREPIVCLALPTITANRFFVTDSATTSARSSGPPLACRGGATTFEI